MKNALAKLFAANLFLIVFVFACAAQNTCDLSLKNAPLFLNLKLKMSPAEAQTIFGSALKIKIKKRGERTFFQNFIKKSAPEQLRGVRAVYLRFYDLQLYQIEIFYEPRNDLKTLEDIENALAAQLNFSATEWQTENNRAEIRCGETSLVADNILNPRVELTDQTIRARIEELRKKDEK